MLAGPSAGISYCLESFTTLQLVFRGASCYYLTLNCTSYISRWCLGGIVNAIALVTILSRGVRRIGGLNQVIYSTMLSVRVTVPRQEVGQPPKRVKVELFYNVQLFPQEFFVIHRYILCI